VKGVDIDSLMSVLEELESKDADFKAWEQMRSDQVPFLFRSSSLLGSVKSLCIFALTSVFESNKT
jgi:hypothetical protein